MEGGTKAKGSAARRSGAKGAGPARSEGPVGASQGQDRSSGIELAEISFTRMLERLKPHDHLCLIYESPEEWRAAVVTFIAIGLRCGEKCIYIADTSTGDEIRRYLIEEGIDVASAEKSGQLSLLHQTETYTREGSFDPDKMIALLISETEKAVAGGYRALRVTGEMTWVLRGLPGSERLLEYEAKLNKDFFPRYPCLAICQYDRWKFDPEIIKGVVMTHPLLIKGNQVYRNFYYIPPEEFLSRKHAEVEVQHWLNSLERERQVQMRLRQSEERYRTLTEQSVMGILVIQDFRIVFANDTSSKISGYSIDELLSLPPEKVQAMVHPEDMALVWGRFRDRLAGKPVPSHYEYRGVRKDGSVRWLEMHAARIEWDGKPAVQAAIIDVTERKQAQEALKESEERYRSLVQAANESIAVVQDGIIKLANPKVVEITGYSIDELKSMNVFALVHPEDRDRLMEYHARRMRGEEAPSFYQFKFIDKAGSVKWLQRSATTIAWEGRPAALVIDTDITEQKRLEEQVLAEKAQLLSLCDSMSEPIYVTDPVTYEILYANKAIEKIFQKPLVGGICYREFQNRQSPCEFCTNDIILKLKGEPYQWEYYNPVLNRHFWLTDRIIKWPDGRDVRFEFAMDVTKLKRAEAKLQHLNKVLQAIRNINQLVARSTDRDSMLRGVCRTFVQTGGYKSAWIALLDESGKLITAAQAGLGKGFRQVVERLKRGEVPYCGRQALEKTGVTIVQDTPSQCADCPLKEEHPGRCAMSIRLEHGGKVYGVMTAWLPPGTAVEKEELELLEEAAGDIAFGLTKMELEEALRRSEERYRTILEDLAEGYYEQDLSGNFTFVNNAMCRLLGYSQDELIRMGYRVYTPEGDVGRRYQIWNRVYRTGEPMKTVFLENIRKDGTRIFVEDSVFPLRNKEGRTIGFRGTSRDITERKRLMEALRESEEKYRRMVETINDIIFSIDTEGNITYISPVTERLSGYKPDEVIGRHFFSFVHPDDLPGLESSMVRTLEGKLEPYECRVFVKNGDVRYVRSLSSLIIDDEGRVVGLTGVLSDITERKLAEKALRESEDKYRGFFENSQAINVLIGLDGKIVDFNRVAAEALGYEKAELIGKDPLQFIVPEQRQIAGEILARGLQGELTPSIELDLVGKKGAVRTFLFAEGQVDVFEEGKRVGILINALDITERKRLEEERRQIELKVQVASRLASVGELTAGVAHEINNPLTGIIGYAQLLMDRKDIPLDAKRDLTAINEGAQRVAGIVKRLLTFSRQVKPERRLVDINEIIESTLLLRDYHLRTNNIKVIAKLDPHLPETIADPGQIQQVLLNLIVNAETEMKLAHGGGKLTITTRKCDGNIEIRVKDNGPGIKPEIMDRIFDPFFTTREVGEGTGLGLSLCYGIVKEHKGNIYAESKPGEGATFIVELPIITAVEVPKPAEPVVEQTEPQARARILVVDDEKVITELVKRVLDGEGYEVDTANNAAGALKMIEGGRYHLILLDVKMPGMDGVELYQRIKGIARSLARRVVFITGDVMGADTERFLSEARARRLDKPFSAEQLRMAVRSALRANV